MSSFPLATSKTRTGLAFSSAILTAMRVPLGLMATLCAGPLSAIEAMAFSVSFAAGFGGVTAQIFTLLSALAEMSFVPSALIPMPTTGPS